MFFLHNLERRVTLHPSYFGKNMHELVTTKLLKDVEGTCAGNYYIISIMDTFEISAGRILPGNGLAEFTVGYRAVVWRPFKGETVRRRLPPPCRGLTDTDRICRLPGRRRRLLGEPARLLRAGRPSQALCLRTRTRTTHPSTPRDPLLPVVDPARPG